MRKEMMYRNEGMAYALRIAKEKGIEGLEEEIKFRNITQMPISVNRKEAEKFVEETKMNCLDTVLIMALNVLNDEFDFSQEQLNQFKARFNFKAENLVDGFMSWKDLQDVLVEEMDIKTEIRNAEQFEEIQPREE